MDKTMLAERLSVWLGPQVFCPLLLLLLVWRSGLTRNEITFILPYLSFLLIIIPFVVVYVAVKRKLISAWDMPLRQERYGFFSMYICLFALAMVTTPIHTTPALWELSWLVLSFIIVNTVITFSWKISLHMGIASLSIILINHSYGWHLFWLFLLLPVIGWSRMYLNRHTLAQVTAGSLLPLLLYYLFYIA